jgi:hypothetical protein
MPNIGWCVEVAVQINAVEWIAAQPFVRNKNTICRKMASDNAGERVTPIWKMMQYRECDNYIIPIVVVTRPRIKRAGEGGIFLAIALERPHGVLAGFNQGYSAYRRQSLVHESSVICSVAWADDQDRDH